MTLSFLLGRTRPVEWRVKQLEGLLRMMDENEKIICEALHKDLRKPRQESMALEIGYIKNDIRGCINNVYKWVADNYVEKNIVTLMDETFIHYDPLGVVLIMGAWNYPIMLSLGPLGNTEMQSHNFINHHMTRIFNAIYFAFCNLDNIYFHRIFCTFDLILRKGLKKKYSILFTILLYYHFAVFISICA